MRIYFGGSIRGGTHDRELYLRLIEVLQGYGDVLTEHIFHENADRHLDPATLERSIYEQDMEWLTAADVVVAEVTGVSLGVGYEIGQADAMGKRVLCLYREQEGRMLSAMLLGNPKLTVRAYRDTETLADAKAIFDEFFHG